jgi:hypothetical protein
MYCTVYSTALHQVYGKGRRYTNPELAASILGSIETTGSATPGSDGGYHGSYEGTAST